MRNAGHWSIDRGLSAAYGIFALFCLLTVKLAAAAPTTPAVVRTPHVTAELVASAGAVRPGGEILLGVRQQIIPHWHTYWKNPGDSGTATSLEWTLPAGAEAGDILWPAPSLVRLGPVANYAYDGEATLLSRIKVPADLPVGGRFPVRLAVSWLVCSEECIPEEAELALTLPVVASGAPVGAGHPAVARAQAAWPVDWPGEARYSRLPDGSLELLLDSARLTDVEAGRIWFFADTWGRIAQSAEQGRALDGSRLRLTVPAGSAPPRDEEVLGGVLVLGEADGRRAAYQVRATPTPVSATAGGADGETPGVLPAVLLALLGGLVLNLMPCVFPVLSIKALALLRHAEQSARQQLLHGFSYTGGVLASFALLALLLIVLKAAGQSVGWGFQYQSPVFVVIVADLMFAVGLNLSGVFAIGAGAAGVGSGLAGRSGYAGSFFTGVLAAVVATPCTAPFMGAAIGYALAQSAPVLLAVFLGLGLGLALPFLALSAWPRLQRLLPRPGVWMERLKEALAFPMYAAAVWLVWVLAQQGGANAVLVALSGMLLIALAAWLYGLAQQSARPRWWHGGLVAAALLAGVLGSGFGVDAVARPVGGEPVATADKPWQPYAAERLAELRRAGQPVFVNMTAAWCISCLVNERVALSDASVIEAFRAGKVAYLKGDWTNKDESISRYLAEFGRSGVPLYVYYPPGDAAPVVLPQLLTPEIVRSAVFSPVSNPSTQPKESS